MTLKELAQEWIEKHENKELNAKYLMGPLCPFCQDVETISEIPSCANCKLASWFGDYYSCERFLDQTLYEMNVDPDDFSNRCNLAWAICEYLANGGS